MLKETRSPNRSVLLWAREKEKRQKRLKKQVAASGTRIEELSQREKEVEEEL